MISQLRIFESKNFDPHENLAIEKYLMDNLENNTCILYLWQNQNTVVIGKNQNAWSECRISLLQEDGGVLARRLSGGGAVFHDLGNLNFTFIMCKEDYDLDKQLRVIQCACQDAGIPVERSGRNDLLVDGKKFSGNAFYQNKTHAYHHGTLMVNVDIQNLGKYLSPPKAKLEAKGISSVRSRVTNLTDYAPALTIQSLKQHMVNAFCQIYGFDATSITLNHSDIASVQQLRETFSSWDFLYGSSLPFRFQCDGLFSCGYIQLQLNVTEGIISESKVFSDAMDWTLPETIETALTGCRFDKPSIEKALSSSSLPADLVTDLCQLLEKQCL